MPNMFWYLVLAVIGVGLAYFVIYKKRKETTIPELIAFYLFAVSITYVGELFALIVFRGYGYKTGILPDPYADNEIGHIIINSTFWPGTALLVAAYSLNYGWIAVITAVYVMIEYLFVKMGIYEQFWWKYYMTAIVVFIFCIIVKTWYKKLQHAVSNLPRYITFYFIARILILLPLTPIFFLGKYQYHTGWTENAYYDSAIFGFIYEFGISLFYVFFVCILNKWYWKLTPVIIVFLGDIILIFKKILIFQNGWVLFYFLLSRVVALGIFILLYKSTIESSRNKNLFFLNKIIR